MLAIVPPAPRSGSTRPHPHVALTAFSSLEEWLADPDGRTAITTAITAAFGTDQHGILGHEELRKVIGNFPLSALAAFPGLGITHDLIRRVTRSGH